MRVCAQLLVASIAPQLFGWIFAFTSPTFVATADCTAAAPPSAVNCYYEMGSGEGLYVSILNLGALAGTALASTFTRRLGHRRALAGINLIYGSAILLHCLTPAPGAFPAALVRLMLLVARVAMGLACGLTIGTVPLYCMALSPLNLRGAFGSVNQICIVLGITLVNFFGIFAHWRTLLYIIGGLAAAGVPLSLAVIEDLEEDDDEDDKGEHELHDAEAGRGTPPPQPDQESMLRALCRIWADPLARKPFLITQGVLIGQQATGINMLMMSMGTIVGRVYPQTTANTIAFAVQLLQLATVLISPVVIESAGRRVILLAGSLVCAASMLVIALAATLGLPSVLAIAPIFVFVSMFGFGLGGIPWFIAGELNSTKNKGVTTSLGGALNWTTSFLVVLTVEPLRLAIGDGGLFIFYTCNCTLVAIFVFLLVPETKGVTVAQITRKLSESSSMDNLKELFGRSPKGGDTDTKRMSRVFTEPDELDAIAEKRKTAAVSTAGPPAPTSAGPPASTSAGPPVLTRAGPPAVMQPQRRP